MKLLLNDKVTTYLKISMLFISILNWEYLKGENTSVVQVVPVSPTAASLGQFGYIPVGHYTGTADISVPLYEIALDGKKFPINIAYHASGIKVAQESGCIGLGWALQGYGAITKQVRGFDDFESFPKGYYWNTILLSNIFLYLDTIHQLDLRYNTLTRCINILFFFKVDSCYV